MNSPERAVRSAAWHLLRDLIHERTGVHFDESSFDLMIDKISTLMSDRGMDSPSDYYYLLKHEGESSGEWPNLVNAISVRETYFWREMDQIHAFVQELLPSLTTEPNEPLRIWSAACASGEEPITIAMALDQAGWFKRRAIQIYGSDIAEAAICAARRGVYRERSFRVLPADLRSRYFKRVGEGWQVDAALHRRIEWRKANLTEESEIQDLARSPVIFCRNVFIYFSEAAIRKVVGVCAQRMPTPGYLFLGAAESLLKFTTRFHLEEIGKAFVYVKR